MRFLIVAIAVSALFATAADLLGRRREVYVFKPLTTVLICALALTLPVPVSGFYRGAIAAGLLFSLGGDVFLMVPGDRFVAGLVSFLVAHICYIAGFASERLWLSPLYGVLLLAWGGLLLAVLWPRLGRLRAPVTVYAAVLLAMVWSALGQSPPGMPAGRAAFAGAGAVLFAVSDSTLAIERFVGAHRWGQPVVLMTYFAAQVLIALSASAG